MVAGSGKYQYFRIVRARDVPRTGNRQHPHIGLQAFFSVPAFALLNAKHLSKLVFEEFDLRAGQTETNKTDACLPTKSRFNLLCP